MSAQHGTINLISRQLRADLIDAAGPENARLGW